MPGKGPPPTPTSILKMRGSWRANIRADEPQIDAKRPACPSWLTPVAKRHWREIVPLLDEMGVLTLIDRAVLARYCEAFATYRAAREVLVREKTWYRKGITQTGDEIFRMLPEVAIERESSKAMLDFEREYGLTPAARARIGVYAYQYKKATKAKDKQQQAGKAGYFRRRA